MADPTPAGCRTSRRCPIPDDPCGPGGARPYCWAADPTPGEDAYRAAAEKALRAHAGDDSVDGLSAEYLDELITNWWDTPDGRVRVDAAYAAGREAGYGQGRDDEANGEELPEWYRLAIGDICRPGQPYGCGDFHHNGKCVRERHDA